MMFAVLHEAGKILATWRAADQIEPVHDHNIPIPEHRLPPTKDNPARNKPRRDKPAPQQRAPSSPPRRQDGHVDEYA